MIKKQNYEEFDNKMKEQMQGYEASYDPILWNDIEVFLNNKQPVSQTFNKKLLIPVAAALVGLILIISLISYLSTRENKTSQAEPVQQTTEDSIQAFKPNEPILQPTPVVADTQKTPTSTVAVSEDIITEEPPKKTEEKKTEEKKPLTDEEKKLAREERKRKKRIRDSLQLANKNISNDSPKPAIEDNSKNNRLGAVEENNAPIESPTITPNTSPTNSGEKSTQENIDNKKKKKKSKKEPSDTTKTR